jgi:ribonuclease-3
MAKKYLEVLKQFNFVPRDEKLFEHAFSHSSYTNEKKGNTVDYERIEYIGDGVLDLVVADLIYRNHPEMGPGPMSKLRSVLVRRESLANYAREFGFGEAILLGNGEKSNGGANLDKILEDVFESFIGAVYLDQGFDFVYGLIKNVFEKDVINFNLEDLTDYKSKLQEFVQADTRESVTYRLVSEEGPAQDKTFIMEVMWEGAVWGVGKGSSKKKAEQEAAKDALNKVAR